MDLKLFKRTSLSCQLGFPPKEFMALCSQTPSEAQEDLPPEKTNGRLGGPLKGPILLSEPNLCRSEFVFLLIVFNFYHPATSNILPCLHPFIRLKKPFLCLLDGYFKEASVLFFA